MSNADGCRFLFIKLKEPTPWTAHEVQVWLAKFGNDVQNPNVLAYFLRGVWAQNPLDERRRQRSRQLNLGARRRNI